MKNTTNSTPVIQVIDKEVSKDVFFEPVAETI
jgi:hypothetical protein